MTIIDIKDIKKQIRALRKIKKDLKTKTEARRDINRRIRELKDKLTAYNTIDSEKQAIIDILLKIRPHAVDLKCFTMQELKHHLKILQRKEIV